MTYTPRTQSTNNQDLHRLVGQIIDHRLRVMSLHHTSPRQWLYQVEPPSVGKTRRALKVLGDPLAREPGAFYRLKTSYERLKRIESPYIEQVYECGRLSNEVKSEMHRAMNSIAEHQICLNQWGATTILCRFKNTNQCEIM